MRLEARSIIRAMAPEEQTAADSVERKLAPGLIAVALAVLFWPALSPALQFAARDAGRMYYPLKHFITDELAHGRLPVWNPFVALGEPLLGGVVSGPLDPLNLLGVVLPFGAGFKAMHLACYLLAAVGAYLWSRGRALSPIASAAGALAFTLGGYLTGVSNNFVYLRGLALVPLFLYAFEAALKRGGAWRVGLAAATWALILFGGEAQCWLLAWPLALLMALFDPATGDRALGLRRALGILAVGALFSAPVLLPALWELPRSDRALFTATTEWWFAPARWAELAVPFLREAGPVAGRSAPWVPSEYLGCLAILVALWGAIDRRGRGLLVILALALWLATGPNLGALVPVWKSFQYPEKLVGWASLAVSGLVALGIERLRGDVQRRVLLAWLAAIAGVAIAGWAFAAHGSFHAAIVLIAAAVLAGALRRRARVFSLALTILLAADLLVAHSLQSALLPAELVQSNGPLAQWLRGNDSLARVSTPFELAAGEPLSQEIVFKRWSRTLVTLWNVEARVGNMGWYGGLASGRYRQLRERGKPGFRYLEAAAAHGAGYLVVPGSLENLKLVGIDPQTVQIRASDPDVPAWLVEVPHRPFAYLAEHVEAGTPEDSLRLVLERGFATSGRTMVERSDSLPLECALKGSARATCPEPALCDIRISSGCAAMLVVNLPPSPGWTATLDGQEVDLAAANFLASAIAVPAGDHSVQLSYRAPGLVEGALLMLLGLLAMIALGLRQRTQG